MLILLAALLQTAPATPAPPAPRPALPPRPTETPYVIEVDASAAGVPLWQGKLRVGSAMASYDRRIRETLPASCGAKPGPTSYASNTFNISLTSFPTREGGSRQMYFVNWEKPASECGSGNVSTAIRMNGNVELAPGQTVTLDGDGGLKLKLTRLAAAN